MRTDLRTNPALDPTTGRWVPLAARAVVPVAAAVALAAGAPQVVTGGLALLGLATAGERLVRLRATDLADRVLVGIGGGLVAIVLTGMVLGSTRIGLSPTSWVTALVVLSLLGLVLAGLVAPRGPAPGRVEDRTREGRRTGLRLVPWVGVAVIVVVVSTRMSATSLTASERPPVQMSFGRVSGTEVQVVVSTSDAVGPLEVRTALDGDEISYPVFSLPEDGSVTTTVSLPTNGRFVISVNYPDQTQPLRTLVLDR